MTATDRLFAAITARASAAAGETLTHPPREERDADSPFAALHDQHVGAPPCTTDGCDDPAVCRILDGTGAPPEAPAYCGRHGQRRVGAGRCVVVGLDGRPRGR